MRALIITDREYHTAAFGQVAETVEGMLRAKGFAVERADIGRGEVASCMGCFGCWVKKPGECVIGDRVAALNRASMAAACSRGRA